MIATSLVINCRNCAQDEPCSTSCAPMVAVSRPVLRPTRIGVPTAPKDTGVLCTSMPRITAASAGKPMATSSGAAMAAGVLEGVEQQDGAEDDPQHPAGDHQALDGGSEYAVEAHVPHGQADAGGE